MAALWQCRLFWGNPYTTPPDGKPRIVKAVLTGRPHPIPDEIVSLIVPGGPYAPGTGWSVGWHNLEQRPVRRWSPEARARVRQANLRRRIEKKFPLFAETFIAEELSRRPAYFAGEDHQHPLTSGERP